jgi:23S rRNA (guanosine2251-2'-O)-methyltransferase
MEPQPSLAEDTLLIYGFHPVHEALQKGKPIHKVVIQSGEFSEHGKKLWALLKGKEVEILRWPKFKIDKVTKGNHQGILAYVSPVAFVELHATIDSIVASGEIPLLCWVDGVSNVRNLGAIIRSASCFGVHAILLPAKSGAMLNSDCIKASAGAIYHMPLVKLSNHHQALSDLAAKEVFIVALTEKASEPINHLPTQRATCLVVGDEGMGISREILDFADGQFRIPITGGTDSLNVSVAAGIAFYEVNRKRVLGTPASND